MPQSENDIGNDAYEGVVQEHEPYILIQGVLEKSKLKRDSFLKFPIRRSKSRWVQRYFVLRCSEIPDKFYLDQYSDQSPASRIRKTLDMERVSQVDTNVSSKEDNRDWIFAIHFSARSGTTPKDSVVYLASKTETEMNRWVAQLCYACNLEKQEDCEPYGASARRCTQGDSMDSFVDTPSSEESVVDRFFDEGALAKSTTDYTLLRYCTSESPKPISDDKTPTAPDFEQSLQSSQPYIHLKDCTSSKIQQLTGASSHGHQRNCSFGSSSTSSVQTSSSGEIECPPIDIPSRTSLDSLVPPPRPPKSGSHFNSLSRNDRSQLYEIYTNTTFHLDQPLPPPALDEIGLEEERGWSGETIRLTEKKEKSPGPAVVRSVSEFAGNVDLTSFMPPEGLIPPKVDRSCKPSKKEQPPEEDNYTKPAARKNSFVRRQEKYANLSPSSPPPRLNSAGASQKPKFVVPPIPRTNPLNRMQRESPKPPASLPGLKGIVVPEQSLPTPTDSVLEYFDPAKGVTVLRTSSSTSVPPDVAVGTAPSVEYVLIDATSTKAVYEANVRQNELRAMGNSMG